MNKKAQEFIKYIEGNMSKDAFAIKEVKDAMHTVLFYANMQFKENDTLKCLVVIDDSQDILIRVDLKSVAKLDKSELETLLIRINELNQKYPIFKFYQDAMTKSVVWEMMYVSHDRFFEPQIVQSYLAWIMSYVPEVLTHLTF